MGPKMYSDMGGTQSLGNRLLNNAYNTIHFPGKRWFRMSQNVINERMIEFTGKYLVIL
jgi:hypothetical protein